MTRSLLPALTVIALLSQLAMAGAQGMAVGFGGLRQDTGAPVEVTADGLTIDQSGGNATFQGNVRVVQGDLRMAADRIVVTYGADGKGVDRLTASGRVTLATAAEAAESTEAVYEVASGLLTMRGGVLLTQGAATIAGDRLVANLAAGTGQMEGQVKTVFQPGQKGGN